MLHNTDWKFVNDIFCSLLCVTNVNNSRMINNNFYKIEINYLFQQQLIPKGKRLKCSMPNYIIGI